MKISDYYFSYSDRHRSGSFDIREVTRWCSKGDFYRQYAIYFKDGETVSLDPDEFYRFREMFDKLDI